MTVAELCNAIMRSSDSRNSDFAIADPTGRPNGINIDLKRSFNVEGK